MGGGCAFLAIGRQGGKCCGLKIAFTHLFELLCAHRCRKKMTSDGIVVLRGANSSPFAKGAWVGLNFVGVQRTARAKTKKKVAKVPLKLPNWVKFRKFG